jgi:sec-independent protein translocase protein TatA
MTAFPSLMLAVLTLGGPELLILLAVLILLFGAKKLPEIAQGLGKSANEFKKAPKEAEAEEGKAEPAARPVAKAPEPSLRPPGNN